MDLMIKSDGTIEGTGVPEYSNWGQWLTQYIAQPAEQKERKIMPEIKNVIFNDPATVIYWKDGTKSVVKVQNCDEYSKEVGFAMCIIKKICGNKGNYNDLFEKWCK